MSESSEPSHSRPVAVTAPARSRMLLAYLQLFRAPNVFTACADVLMGYLFTTGYSVDPRPLLGLLLASACLYTAGMVLNDVFDIEQDRRERPQRPVPSGRIGLGRARRIGWGLLFLGVVSAAGADWYWARGHTQWGTVSVTALALAACVVLYDGVLKKTLLGPWTMGACRTANVLLGMTGGLLTADAVSSWWSVDISGVVVALGIGVYIAGVTWFARSEAADSHRVWLGWGLFVMIAGFVLLALFPQYGQFAVGTRVLTFGNPLVWPLLLLLLGISLLRRALLAIAFPTPQRVQVTVKQCIVSLIVLDAAVCLAVRYPAWWAIGILALLVPMLVLGRWVYST